MVSNALLKTKLRPPVIGRDIVQRDRLHHRLDAHRPLTLVVAPAGYGKTTLVVGWLEHSRSPGVWLTLDAYDNSLADFVAGLLAALQTLFSAICPETQALLSSASPPSPSAVARTLANELEELPHGIVLVMDDFHAVRDLAVHQMMAELLVYQPHTLELVLLARHDPLLPLSALRLHNHVTEIRTEELRFTHEESKAFLQHTYNLRLDDAQVAALEQMTEGWAAGLRLAALRLQQQGDPAEARSPLDGGGSLAMAYLVQEVFSNLAPQMQEFLLKTVILEQVCAPLGAAVVGGEITAADCQRHLDALVENNLFVFALQGEGGWHRYHQLFRTVLQHRAEQVMSAAEIAALHARASAWLAGHGSLDAATNHAVQAGDVQVVAALVRSHRHQLMSSGDWSQMETCRRLIPRALLVAHPQLLSLDAWSLSRRALPADCAWCLDAIESLLAAAPLPADEERLLRSELDAMRSQSAYWAGDVERSLEAARNALAARPARYAYARALAWLLYILSLEATGQAGAASAALAEALCEGAHQRGSAFETLVFTAAGFLHWVRADMVGMEDYARRMLTLAQERGHYESVAYAHYFRGCASYQQNDLARAEQDFAAVLDLAHSAHPFIYSQSFIGLAATYQARGEFAKAYAVAMQGLRHFQESGNDALAALVEGYLAHLSLRQGKMNEALSSLARPSRITLASSMSGFHTTPIGRAAILLSEGSAEGLAEAAELLALLRTSAEGQHNSRFLIEVLALQALTLATDGDQAAALDLLERAVLLAVPGQAIRTLADYYDQIGFLLEQLAQRGIARSQLALIRRAARVSCPYVQPRAGMHVEAGWKPVPAAPAAALEHDDILERLTHREMDVLNLLLERLSNKEIAQQLNIALDTVKQHMTNIFAKLHVQNRRQAIVRARRSGIFPPQ